MSTCAVDCPGLGWRPLPRGRWGGLALLLLAELLGLSLRFDMGAVARAGRAWGQLVAAAHFLPQLALVTALSLLVLGGDRLWAGLTAQDESREDGPSCRLALAAHLLALLGFFQLTRLVAEGDLASSAAPGAWAVAWLVAGLLTLLFWMMAVVPAGLWLRWAGRCWPALLLAGGAGAAAWAASRLTAALWLPLGRATVRLVELILGLFLPGVVCRPDEFVVGTSDFAVEIAPQCSGYEGVGLVTAFLGVYLWCDRARFRFPAALLLLPLGAAVSWLANVLRIVLLITIGACGAPDVALGGFHSQAGWLAFNAVALGLVAVSRYAWATPAGAASVGRANPTAAYVAPLMALVAATMVSGALSSGFDRFYPVRVVAVLAALWWFRADYAGLHWGGSWAAVGLGCVVFAVWLGLEGVGPPGQALGDGLASVPAGWAVLWLAFRLAGSVVTAPLAEELAFRGYLLRRLVDRDFAAVSPRQLAWLPLLVSSALFATLHPGRWLAGLAAGVIYALALHRRGSVGDAVLAHATTNGLLAGHVLLTGRWSLWC